MLELTDKNLKVAVITLLKGVKENMLIINEQTGNISHCIETTKRTKTINQIQLNPHQHLPSHCELCFSFSQ